MLRKSPRRNVSGSHPVVLLVRWYSRFYLVDLSRRNNRLHVANVWSVGRGTLARFASEPETFGRLKSPWNSAGAESMFSVATLRAIGPRCIPAITLGGIVPPMLTGVGGGLSVRSFTRIAHIGTNKRKRLLLRHARRAGDLRIAASGGHCPGHPSRLVPCPQLPIA